MANERRLLIVTESLGIGGTETHLIRLLAPLAAQEWSIAIFCLSQRGQRANEVEAAGIRVVSPPRLASRGAGRGRNPAKIILGASRLFWLMQRWRPAVVHFYLPGPYILGAPLAMAARIPTKIMSRRSLSHYQTRRPMLARFERVLHSSMDAVIGNSRAVVRELMSEGIPPTKVKLIYNGTDTSLVFPRRIEARRALGIEQEALVGVMIANLIPYKGHRDLIEGLARVSARLPTGWLVLFAGHDDGLQSELEKLTESFGLQENIRFLGERRDVQLLLAAADYGVLSSWEEGFSNAILEAMAAGLPMVATDVGGNSDAVLHERTGLLVPPQEPAALGNAILRLAHEPSLRRALGVAAQLRVRQEFSLERCIEAHEKLYEALLASAEKRGGRKVGGQPCARSR